ncbi:MAG: YkvA family protein [Pseudomonadota bacterium]
MKKAEIDEILMPGDAETMSEQEAQLQSKFWDKVTKFAGRIPFMEDVVAGYYCALDPETPTKVRGILLASLAYFILPLDSIPDFLVGFGFSDDIAVLTAAFAAIQGHLKDSHRDAAREKLSGSPEKSANS